MNLAGFDLETTGTDTLSDVPVQVGLVILSLLDEGTPEARWDVQKFNVLCNPGKPIAEEASNIHGITNDRVANEPQVEAVIEWFDQMLTYFNPSAVITYNGKSFDVPMVERLSVSKVIRKFKQLDVLDAAYRYLPEMENHKLSTIYRNLFGKPLEGAHDALADVLATVYIAQAISQVAGKTLLELADDMAVPRPWSVMPIGKYKGRSPSVVPKSWANFILSQNAGQPEYRIRPDLRETLKVILA